MRSGHWIIFIIVSGAAAAAAPLAVAGPAEPRQCFYARDVDNFEPVDDTTVNIRVGVKDVYQLKLLVPCGDIRFNQSLGIRTTGGSDLICSGLDVALVSPGPTGPQRCPAASVRKLSAAEAAALPKRQKP